MKSIINLGQKPAATALLKTLLSVSIVFALAACNGDDGEMGPQGSMGAPGTDGMDGMDGSNGSPAFPVTTFLLSNNGADNAGMVNVIDQNAAALKTFTSANNEGIALDPLANMIQAGDKTVGSVRTICHVSARADGAMYSANIDRDITGATTGLTNPKGIHIAQGAGLIMIADFNGMRVSIFGSAAAGDVAPLAETMTTAKPWDLTYDEINDRLFVALTDGTVAVYDGYVSGGFGAMPARVITPSDDMQMAMSVNIHGIVYDRSSDKLVLSDVGDASSASDGAIFVIGNASLADGNVTVERSIAGPSTMLGNPVDIVLSGSDLRVAEKSNDAILVFSNIFAGPSGDIAPTLATAATKPESLVEFSASMTHSDVSDTWEADTTLLGVAVSSNPSASGATTGMVGRFSSVLNAQLSSFDHGLSIESVTFDLSGDSYTTFDDPVTSMGGILVGNRVATSREAQMYTPSRDRMIAGANTGLISPKGIDVASQKGLIFVAENNATTPSIRVFSSCSAGDVSPLLTLVASGAARPWDVDYDALTDRAFVALTNGTVAVFDEVTAKLAAGTTTITGEDRLITPAMSGVAIVAPSNIHGIDYDPASDSLILSDVGSAADATDGKLYVLPAAKNASGLTDISVSIAGSNTMLGNPVDIMFTGKNLYVAEKSNGLIMRFDNILNSAGGDISADASMAYTAPESVAIIPNYLYRQE
jgi:hypothetical protein